MLTGYKNYKTVGELIDILSTVPRDTLIITKNSNTMEKIGFQIGDTINIELRKFKTEKRWTCDAFDGTNYSYDAILSAKDSDENTFEGLYI